MKRNHVLLLLMTLSLLPRAGHARDAADDVSASSTPFQLAAAQDPDRCKPGRVLPTFKAHKQDTNYWCWAACTQMVLEYFGVQFKQCKLVNDRVHRQDCCPFDMAGADCLVGGWPPLCENGFTYQETFQKALTPAQVVDELGCHARPFIFSDFRDKAKTTGHMMVAVDYKTVDGKDLLTIVDPLATDITDQRDVEFWVYETGAFGHWNDFYAIGKK